MPLSEDEQRILRQIEEHLQRDPSFGRDIRTRSASSRRMAVVTGLGALALLALAVVLLAVSPYLAFAAFVGAVFVAVKAFTHLSHISAASFSPLGQTVRQRFGRSAPRRD
jgi:Protein of unknown function (DUF3040)